MALEAKNLENIPWVRVRDWSALTASDKRPDCKYNYVRSKDIDRFINRIVRRISKKLNLQYGEVKSLVTSKNLGFYIEKKKLFAGGKSYPLKGKSLRELESRLLIPDIDCKSAKSYLVFVSLSDEDKRKFLELIKQTEV